MTTELPKGIFQFIKDTTLRQQIIVSILSVGVFLLTLVPLELQRLIVNDVVTDQNIDLLVSLSLLYLGAVLIHGMLKYQMNMSRGKISESTIRLLRNLVIERSTSATSSNQSESSESEGTIVSAVAAEVEPLGGFIGESISGPVLQGGILVSVLAYMFWVEPLLAVIGIGLYLPQLLFVPPIQNIINTKAKLRIETLRELSETIVDRNENEAVDGQRFCDECAPNIDTIYNLRTQMFRWKFFMKFLVNFLEHLGTIGVIAIGGWLVIQGKTEIGTIVAFVSGLSRIGDPWRALIIYFRQITDARIKYELIRDISPTNN